MYETKYGKFILNENDEVDQHVRDGKLWEPDLIKALEPYLSKQKDVVEVGSYIGDHTVYLSTLCRKIYTFEGDTLNYSRLITNLQLNGCKNVKAYNNIIGSGFVIPADNTAKFKNNSELNPAGHRYISSGFGESTFGLDEVLQKERLDVSVLKIDCEGMDYSVLTTAMNLVGTHRPVIAFEYNWYISNEKPEDFDKLLKPLGYKPAVRIDTWNWLCTMQ